jgi:hypothetical protein
MLKRNVERGTPRDAGFELARIAAFYRVAALAALNAHWVSVKTTPGDSGESAIPFFLLTVP